MASGIARGVGAASVEFDSCVTQGRTYHVRTTRRKGVMGVAFRAKTYENRKKEKKLQVSGDQAEFNKLAKGDKATLENFTEVVSAALNQK